jgi:putative heme degradation protein
MSTVVQLEPWLDKKGLSDFYSCGITKIEEMTAKGMPSAMIFGKRKYRASECEAWLERAGEIRREA